MCGKSMLGGLCVGARHSTGQTPVMVAMYSNIEKKTQWYDIVIYCFSHALCF